MLCADVAHKVLRMQTVLEFLYEIYGQCRNKATFYDDAKKKMLGEIVLTCYNNKTYRVDDIAWDKHPSDTFEKSDGSKISFKEYYEQVGNLIKIWSANNLSQSNLIHNPIFSLIPVFSPVALISSWKLPDFDNMYMPK